MTVPFHPSLPVTFGIAALVVWRIASRVRRMVGRQHLSRVRPWLAAIAFPVLALVLLLVALPRPQAAIALLAGCAIGIALGRWGLRLTRFEATPIGLFYTPNAYLGVALSVLLIARLGWRYLQVFGSDVPFASTPADYGRSPLTLLIFGMLAGYYATYAVGLLRWKAQVQAQAAPVPGS